MLRCKKVGETLDKYQHYEEIPRLKRLGLKMHIALCRVCGSFHKNIMVFQDGTKEYREQEENLGGSCCLHDEKKQAMKDRLKAAQATAANTNEGGRPES